MPQPGASHWSPPMPGQIRDQRHRPKCYPWPRIVLPLVPCWLSQAAFYVPPTIYVFEANSYLTGYPQVFGPSPYAFRPVQDNGVPVFDYRPSTAPLVARDTAAYDASWSGTVQAGLASSPNAHRPALSHLPANAVHPSHNKPGKRRRDEPQGARLPEWKRPRMNEAWEGCKTLPRLRIGHSIGQTQHLWKTFDEGRSRLLHPIHGSPRIGIKAERLDPPHPAHSTMGHYAQGLPQSRSSNLAPVRYPVSR